MSGLLDNSILMVGFLSFFLSFLLLLFFLLNLTYVSFIEEEIESDDDADALDDWNTRFQNVIGTLRGLSYTDDSTLEQRAEANEELMHLSQVLFSSSSSFPILPNSTSQNLFLIYKLSPKQDFIHAAQTYGRIIISEVYLPVRKKTIKPLNLGGVAGGDKYVVHNILFKFAVDSAGLFGGNNLAAAKVGGLELKGLVSYFRFLICSFSLLGFLF